MSFNMTPWQPPPPGAIPIPPPATYAMPVPGNMPAYTAVQARQTFGAPVPQYYPPPPVAQSAHVEAPPAKRKKIEWPQSVRSYVQRSFDPSNMIPEVSKEAMEAKLKQTITAATDTDTLYTTDWDRMPLPQHMIQKEKAESQPPWRNPADLGGYVALHQSFNQTSKKRKSDDIGSRGDEHSSNPPWRNTNGRSPLEDRITAAPKDRFEKRDSPVKQSKFQKALEKRQRRFESEYKSNYRSPTPEPSTGPVVGTNTQLEKRYLRLTSAPNPALVRPLHILRETLELLKKKWRKESNYSYICDQFKSLRQDLTVQHIKNEFTVTVYEIHARIALEKGDLGEYNQCQTQLRSLYAQNLGGHPVEFKAYRILYFIHTSNRTALNDALADLTAAEKEEKPIKHALGVRSALALGNYHRFFRLYLDTPNMGAYLMDMFVVRERLAALANICKAYKPDVKLRFITEELGFESDGDAAQFIFDQNGQYLLEERDDGIRLLTGKAGPLFETARSAAFRRVDIKGQI